MRFTYDDRSEAELEARISTLLNRFAEAIAKDARDNCPRGSWDELESLPYRSHTADTIMAIGNYVVVDNYPLWFYLEYGTRRHRIRARRGGALWWDGARHPVREVDHPGTPEYAFMRRALYKRRGVLK